MIPQPNNADAQEILAAVTEYSSLLLAVAKAAEKLQLGNQLEAGAVEMNKRWLVLEQALNEWRAAK